MERPSRWKSFWQGYFSFFVGAKDWNYFSIGEAFFIATVVAVCFVLFIWWLTAIVT